MPKYKLLRRHSSKAKGELDTNVLQLKVLALYKEKPFVRDRKFSLLPGVYSSPTTLFWAIFIPHTVKRKF